MTVANLFAQHRAGKVSKEKFLYEVRRDAQLPFISNLTSYEDAIKMLKQKSVIKEAAMYGSSDGDYDQNQKDKEEIELVYDAGYAAFSAGDMERAEKLYKRARFLGAYLAWDERDLPPYDQVKESKSPKRLVKEGVNTTDKFDVVLKNGERYFNVTFIDRNSFETEDGVSMMNQNIVVVRKSPEKQGGLNESKKIIKEIQKDINGTPLHASIAQIMGPDDPLAKKHVNDWTPYDHERFWHIMDMVRTTGKAPGPLSGKNRFPVDEIGKSKSLKTIVKEQTDLHLQIDRLNPILVKKAVNSELAKLPMIDAQVYQKMTEKVVKKLQKDPKAYDDVVVANAKEIHKIDEKSKMVPVKNELKDPHHQMKSPKGTEKIKSNTKASKTENKKGKPKGVKEMSSAAKGHKGVEQMKHPEKNHKIMESLLSFMFKKKLNEDTHHEYGVGQAIDTPDGRGTVKEIIGSTVTLEFESTGDLKDYQMNVLTHFKEEAKKPVEEKTPEVKKEMPTMDEKKDKVIQKVMEFLKKKKKMKEVQQGSTQISTANPTNPDSVAIQTAKNLAKKGLPTSFVKPTAG